MEDRRGNRPRGGSVGHSVATGHAVNWKLEEAAAGGVELWIVEPRIGSYRIRSHRQPRAFWAGTAGVRACRRSDGFS